MVIRLSSQFSGSDPLNNPSLEKLRKLIVKEAEDTILTSFLWREINSIACFVISAPCYLVRSPSSPFSIFQDNCSWLSQQKTHLSSKEYPYQEIFSEKITVDHLKLCQLRLRFLALTVGAFFVVLFLTPLLYGSWAEKTVEEMALFVVLIRYFIEDRNLTQAIDRSYYAIVKHDIKAFSTPLFPTTWKLG